MVHGLVWDMDGMFSLHGALDGTSQKFYHTFTDGETAGVFPYVGL